MISKWVYNWKTSFNPDPKNPRKRYYSVEKNSNTTYPIISFNNVQIQRRNQQKPLGIILDEKLNFKSRIDKFLTKASKGIAVKRRLIKNSLLRKSLINIYKAIIRPVIDYGDILYDQHNNATFCQKTESFNTKQLLQLLVQLKVPHKKNF